MNDIFQYYMIWIYHIFFNFILIHDHKDLLSTILFIMESICLITHVVLWKRGKTNDYANMYKTWYLTFIIVIIYAFIRYLLFFMKYSTINYSLKESYTLRKICYNLVAKELLDREMGVIDHSYVLKHYTCPILLLSLGVLTRNAFSKNFHIKKEMNKISKNLGIGDKSNNDDLNLNLRTRAASMPKTEQLSAIIEEETLEPNDSGEEEEFQYMDPKLIDSDASSEEEKEEAP